MERHEPLLTIIYVNYKSSTLIRDSIESIIIYNNINNIKFIIVDNDSKDDSETFLRTRFPFIQWISMGYNSGFARANNAGIRASSTEYILLLNPDTLMKDDSVTNCLNKFSSSQYAAVGVQLLDEKGKRQISGSYFMKGGINHLLPIPYYGDVLVRLSRIFSVAKPGVDQPSDETMVDWISGAYLMTRQSSIKQAGLMDEDFFLYAEEVEWCSRLQKAGKLCVYGGLSVIHLEGQTIDKSHDKVGEGYSNLYDKKGLQLMVSNHLRVRKQYGVFWFFFLLVNFTMGFFFYTFVSSILILFSTARRKPTVQKINGFGDNVYTLWKLAPKIISNKKHFYKMI